MEDETKDVISKAIRKTYRHFPADDSILAQSEADSRGTATEGRERQVLEHTGYGNSAHDQEAETRAQTGERVGQVAALPKVIADTQLTYIRNLSLPPACNDEWDNRHTGYVYIIKEAEAEMYKIGHSQDLLRRFTSLAWRYPFYWRLSLWLPTTRRWMAEKCIHRRLHEHRVVGEWFRLTEANLDWLRSLPRLDLDACSELLEEDQSYADAVDMRIFYKSALPHLRERYLSVPTSLKTLTLPAISNTWAGIQSVRLPDRLAIHAFIEGRIICGRSFSGATVRGESVVTCKNCLRRLRNLKTKVEEEKRRQ